MQRTEFTILLYVHIRSAIMEFVETHKDWDTYDNYRLSIEPDDRKENIIPYEVKFVPSEQADYLFMPRLSELIDYYVDEQGNVEPTDNISSIAPFIDRWIGSGRWTEEPL